MPQWLKITIHGKDKYTVEQNGKTYIIYDETSKGFVGDALFRRLLSFIYKDSTHKGDQYVVDVNGIANEIEYLEVLDEDQEKD